jgi:hydrogenase maturation protein HypF
LYNLRHVTNNFFRFRFMSQNTERFSLLVKGQVQGVGFRPWVFRLALRWALTGFVRNDTGGVRIEIQGPPAGVRTFIAALRKNEDAPPLARIEDVTSSQIVALSDEREFVIAKSDASGTPLAGVTPDSAVCRQCLDEMRDPSDFRWHYPFINCTNCGPRYTIIKTIPYDRPNTTMSSFGMCAKCAEQYSNVGNRRFHAQPVACPACGPMIWLADATGTAGAKGTDETVSMALRYLLEGAILAIKGIGGFHLAVDACNDNAVQRLRARKHREHKPFAMMAGAIETIRRCAEVPPLAKNLLASPQSPIVLLAQKADSPVAPSVAPGTNTFGFMLAYAPLHHLLFDGKLDGRRLDVLVMTSANLADQPLICRNDEALEKLSTIADFFLMHDRDIYRQLDDSIVHFVDKTPVLLRRGRGYVPVPIVSKMSTSREILAAGSDLKNTFCLVRDEQFIVSEHIGDLEDADVYRHYRRSISHLQGLFEINPSLVVADLHPGYFSRQYADSLKGVASMYVQHHWAHIASVLAEHGQDGPVIGIAADGTGHGTDGAIWGCECLIASLADFSRFAHLKYFPLAGGDKASKEPIRPIIALLDQTLGEQFALKEYKWLLDPIEPDGTKQSLILEQIRKGVNTNLTSSLGRVFDAVAAMAGIGNFNHFEAQLPIGLEAIADAGCRESYPFELTESRGPLQLDLGPMFRSMISDIKRGQPAPVLAGRFHNTIAAAFLAIALKAHQTSGLKTVALSGGVFCNRLLAGRTIELLNKNGFSVLYNVTVPANDGGLSLGQAAIAAHKFKK